MKIVVKPAIVEVSGPGALKKAITRASLLSHMIGRRFISLHIYESSMPLTTRLWGDSRPGAENIDIRDAVFKD